jgi:UDP-N-acetylmuramoyl-tripeptide--D-alanyl-D-alanine ligase
VVEVGIDRVGQMSRQSRMLQPDVAVITAVGSEHQSGLGSLDTTQREKARLLEGLRRPGLAILNGDDPRVRAMAGWTDARVVTYGLGPGNDVRASGVRLEWPRGTRFTLHADGATRELCLQLLGRTMVAPALAAVAVATNQGLALDDVVAALERLAPTPGRLQVVALPDQVRLIRDDTKASVETIHAAFVLAEIPGRRLLVLSESPEWPESLEASYRCLGRRMADMLEAAIFVGDAHGRLAACARGRHAGGGPAHGRARRRPPSRLCAGSCGPATPSWSRGHSTSASSASRWRCRVRRSAATWRTAERSRSRCSARPVRCASPAGESGASFDEAPLLR